MRLFDLTALALSAAAIWAAIWTTRALGRLELVEAVVGAVLVFLLLRATVGVSQAAAVRVGRPR